MLRGHSNYIKDTSNWGGGGGEFSKEVQNCLHKYQQLSLLI